VFVIVNKVDDLLTGNLQGPLVVNVETRQARQLVLSDRRYSTRHPLMRVPAQAAGDERHGLRPATPWRATARRRVSCRRSSHAASGYGADAVRPERAAADQPWSAVDQSTANGAQGIGMAEEGAEDVGAFQNPRRVHRDR
jgi:hypothetical protein